MFNLKTIILSSSLLNIACGSVVKHQSTTKDVATPGLIDTKNKLFWYENELLVTGECTNDQLPIRNHCQTNKRTAPFIHTMEQVKKEINNDIQTTEANIVATTKALRQSHPDILQIRNEITQLDAQLEKVKTNLLSFSKELRNITALISKTEAKIADYDAQLAAVDAQLSEKPTDQFLMNLKNSLETERYQLTQNNKNSTIELTKTASNIDLETQNMFEMQKQIDTQNKLLADKLQSINVEDSAELKALVLKKSMFDQELISVPEVFALIRNQEVAFRTNLFNDLQKSILNRVDLLTESKVRITSNGIVEVKIGEKWGGICDNGFNQRNAEVICRTLGKNLLSYSVGQAASIGYAMDYLACYGNENNIMQCSYRKSHDCQSGEYVSVSCQ